ncbi:DEAD/DEAH box helicase family protein [Glutamicibacter creatinolyticus]|uniref:DEAD/DEAH box helicase family protein n=1 Tax=Glutamicibacter creatinolyticus TaxID=162496 RepID=UPI0037BE8260
MVDDLVWSGSLSADIRFGFLDSAVTTGRKLHPEVVINADGVSVLRTLREQIANCRSFVFSVAFVTPRAVALLKQELVDFGGIGTIITSDYLGFNSPRAFRELKNLEVLGVEVRLHQAHAFHPKGYIFQHEDGVTLMVGSSNLTEGAISKNHEWNLKVSASKLSNLSKQVDDLVSRELEESVLITDEWIDSYEDSYIPLAPAHSARQSQNSAPVSAFEEVSINEMPILPNRMQEAALKEIEAIRVSGARRAIVVSATGTGKTILSALEVRAANPKRFLFIVHREQIVAKTMSEYQRVLGGDPALYGKGLFTIQGVIRV